MAQNSYSWVHTSWKYKGNIAKPMLNASRGLGYGGVWVNAVCFRQICQGIVWVPDIVDQYTVHQAQ